MQMRSLLQTGRALLVARNGGAQVDSALIKKLTTAVLRNRTFGRTTDARRAQGALVSQMEQLAGALGVRVFRSQVPDGKGQSRGKRR